MRSRSCASSSRARSGSIAATLATAGPRIVVATGTTACAALLRGQSRLAPFPSRRLLSRDEHAVGLPLPSRKDVSMSAISVSANWLDGANGDEAEAEEPIATPVFEGQKLVVVGGSSGTGRQTAPEGGPRAASPRGHAT